MDLLLSIGPAALNRRPEPAPTAQTIHLMEIATMLTGAEMTLTGIAKSLGRPPHSDEITSDWVRPIHRGRHVNRAALP